jgi:hypothetical protein
MLWSRTLSDAVFYSADLRFIINNTTNAPTASTHDRCILLVMVEIVADCH